MRFKDSFYSKFTFIDLFFLELFQIRVLHPSTIWKRVVSCGIVSKTFPKSKPINTNHLIIPSYSFDYTTLIPSNFPANHKNHNPVCYCHIKIINWSTIHICCCCIYPYIFRVAPNSTALNIEAFYKSLLWISSGSRLCCTCWNW